MEMDFYINRLGKIKYNKKCEKCVHNCKQSYKAQIVKCPKYKKQS